MQRVARELRAKCHIMYIGKLTFVCNPLLLLLLLNNAKGFLMGPFCVILEENNREAIMNFKTKKQIEEWAVNEKREIDKKFDEKIAKYEELETERNIIENEMESFLKNISHDTLTDDEREEFDNIKQKLNRIVESVLKL